MHFSRRRDGTRPLLYMVSPTTFSILCGEFQPFAMDQTVLGLWCIRHASNVRRDIGGRWAEKGEVTASRERGFCCGGTNQNGSLAATIVLEERGIIICAPRCAS